MLARASVCERHLSLETFITKLHQDMGFQQQIDLSEKSWTKRHSLFETTDIENRSLVDNLSWATNSYTAYALCCPHGPVLRFFMSLGWQNAPNHPN